MNTLHTHIAPTTTISITCQQKLNGMLKLAGTFGDGPSHVGSSSSDSNLLDILIKSAVILYTIYIKRILIGRSLPHIVRVAIDVDITNIRISV